MRNGWPIAAGALAGGGIAVVFKLASNQSANWVLLALAAVLGAAYLITQKPEQLRQGARLLKRKLERISQSVRSRRAKNTFEEPELSFLLEVPTRAECFVIHGSIRQFNALCESRDSAELASQLNDFFTIVSARVKARQGKFERYAGSSFIAYWDSPTPALLCSLELRKDFATLNEAFKVDGHKAFAFGMGAASGMALSARIGPSDDMRPSIVGEVIACARALDHLSAVVGHDLLISGELWKKVSDQFFGEMLGEAKLTNESGLTEYRSLTGYWDSQGRPVQVQASFESCEPAPSEKTLIHAVTAKKPSRWLVNNGSQIIGPFLPEEIAQRLLAQELDFDCECWREGTGDSAQIKNSGIFGTCNDLNATLWIFDGETVHGPLSAGFLSTAIERGLVPADSRYCEGSTVSGWKSVSSWSPNFTSDKAAA